MPTITEILTRLPASWNDPAALAALGKELHDRNRLPAARLALERALELDPEVSDEAWIHLAFSWFRGFGEEKGFETLRQGIEVTDSDRIRSTLLGFTPDDDEREALRAKLEESDEPAIRADLEWAKVAAGDEGAFDRVARLREEHPEDGYLRETWCWTLIGARRRGVKELDLRETGVPVADAMIAENPDAAAPRSMKCQMLLAEEDWDGLLAATGEALARSPDDETVMQWRATALEKKGDEERAAHWYARAIGAKPSFAGARRDLGKLRERQGKPELAEELFREIPVANPDYPLGRVSLALFLARREQWDEAERLVIEAWPELPIWARGAIRNQPDAAELMSRDAVAAAIGEEE